MIMMRLGSTSGSAAAQESRHTIVLIDSDLNCKFTKHIGDNLCFIVVYIVLSLIILIVVVVVSLVTLLIPALTCKTKGRLWRVVFLPVKLSIRTTEEEIWMEVGVTRFRPLMLTFIKAAPPSLS